MQKITPCLWFDSNIEEAVRFYASAFKKSKIGKTATFGDAGAKVSGMKKGSVMSIPFEIEGYEFLALNGGPLFKFTPAISFFVYCKTKKEIDSLYTKLSAGGLVRMPLDKYPFSEWYAFVSDRFGVSWQLILGDSKQKIVPSLLFVGKLLEKTEEAIRFYLKTFKKSKLKHLQKYGAGGPAPEGSVMHALFSLEGQDFTAMSGPGKHDFTFTEATSLIVNCKTQKEVDRYWEALSKGGSKGPCGWLKDKYGVSWQVVPTTLDILLADKDPIKVERTMKAMLQMGKLDIKKLEEAYGQ